MHEDWGQRLGFACKIAGQPIKTSDGRKPQNNPHLRYSLSMLLDVMDYLQQTDVRMFRMPSDLCPYPTHPDYPELNWKKQFSEAKDELVQVKQRLEEQPVRLSFHPSQFVLLSSPDRGITRRSIAELRWQAELLDQLGCGPEARVLIHLGGVYGERERTRERIIKNIEKLPMVIKDRLALENDDVSWGASDTLQVCRVTGTPMIFDFHHHACLNHGEDWREMLQAALWTWPSGVRPKTHLSSPKLMAKSDKDFRAGPLRAHADYIDPWTFLRLIRESEQLRLPIYDIMLEAKAKDLALLKLRDQSTQLRPRTLP